MGRVPGPESRVPGRFLGPGPGAQTPRVRVLNKAENLRFYKEIFEKFFFLCCSFSLVHIVLTKIRIVTYFKLIFLLSSVLVE